MVSLKSEDPARVWGPGYEKTIDKRDIVVSYGKVLPLYLVMEQPIVEGEGCFCCMPPLLDATRTTLGGSLRFAFGSKIPVRRR